MRGIALGLALLALLACTNITTAYPVCTLTTIYIDTLSLSVDSITVDTVAVTPECVEGFLEVVRRK